MEATMPGSLIERPKMTRTMFQALKRHIMKERERKRHEQEHDVMITKRLKMEEEMRKKKEQEDSLTLEQTKEQISQLEKKMEDLKTERHELFSQLKEVLRQEDETRKMEKLKEQGELQIMQHNTVLGMPYSRSGRPMLYRPPQSSTVQQVGMKRKRSPSPPPSQSYQYSNKKMATSTPVEKQHPYTHSPQPDYEQEHDPMMMKRLKKEEMIKKKNQDDSLALEQTKEQISQLEKKMEDLKNEKHELFSLLKEVFRQEYETRKMEKLKEQSELQIMQQSTVLGMPYSRSGRPMLYRPPQSSTVQPNQPTQSRPQHDMSGQHPGRYFLENTVSL